MVELEVKMPCDEWLRSTEEMISWIVFIWRAVDILSPETCYLVVQKEGDTEGWEEPLGKDMQNVNRRWESSPGRRSRM